MEAMSLHSNTLSPHLLITPSTADCKTLYILKKLQLSTVIFVFQVHFVIALYSFNTIFML